VFLFVGLGNSLVLLLPLKSKLQKQQAMCCQWDGYKNRDEKLNRRGGIVFGLNEIFQIKSGHYFRNKVEFTCNQIFISEYDSNII